jgi:uncharacterized protein (TIGR02271 family)
MSRTITALFNDRSEAEAAAAQLRAQVGSDARIVDQSSGSSGSSSGSGGSGEGRGFWAELKEMFVAEDDRPTYEEGVRRGHFMLSANVPEEQADRACSLIDQAGAIDIDENEQKWRGEGWSGGSSSVRSAFSSNQAAGSERSASSSDETSENQRSSAASGERGNVVQEERIPIVEEQLRVGKREEQRGGARVRSYIEERPVSEQVNLREEHVSVERRPVDQALSSSDLDSGDLLRERSVEMSETTEVPVVGKEARVKEVVVVQKTADQHSEQVDDTVRNTRVDVDQEPDSERNAIDFDKDR